MDFLGEKKPLREHPQANKALKFQKVDSLGEKKPLREHPQANKASKNLEMASLGKKAPAGGHQADKAYIYHHTIICLCPENRSVYVQKIKAFVSCLHMMEFVIYKEKLKNCVFTKN